MPNLHLHGFVFGNKCYYNMLMCFQFVITLLVLGEFGGGERLEHFIFQ
jgi:hypothetical protein